MSINDLRVRQMIAAEAARIILDEGVVDYRLAKRKAAERLGAGQTRNLPRNTEIEAAVFERQRLFEDDASRLRLTHLRQAAVQAMQLLEPFHPRLVGPVLAGIVNGRDELTLHIFADSPEEVIFYLQDRGVTWRSDERRFKGAQGHVAYPCLEFGADGVDVDAVVFPVDGIRQPPPSPVDGRPMRRADVREVERLLEGQ
ncbi:hypothetical protein SAMN05421721_1267 [Ectothiorhodospira mobilis]|uniref:Nucleotidyltransferase n=1 Tax=Ectothiorhodospira mobilis TaxID=195064 RepID=A0A1I4SZU7_ECTMO|nr:hypothetical protein [Ectothiorhodospira mobilis]SFM70002.1 hypothetical protein SAMN05421721_1267 [Ectothiorhodospira mobilis]